MQDDEVVIDGHAYRHLYRARRLDSEEVVRFVDGAGAARFGRALEIKPAAARFSLGDSAPANEPSRWVELLAPVPKASRLAWMVEKATEVGVAAIRLIHSTRAPRKLGRGTLERLGRVAVAAVQQSHRARVPEITGVHGFGEIPEILAAIPDRWLLQPGSPDRFPDYGVAKVALLVGPEGGWTAAELERLATWGCRSTSLGPTVLRIETAATVGCAALLIPRRAR